MDILTLIITIVIAIMTLTSEKIMFLIKSLFCGISGYWLLNFKYPNLKLIDFNDYSLIVIQNWIKSGLFAESLFVFIISWFLFYYLLPNVFQIFIEKPLFVFANKYFEQIDSTLKDKRFIDFAKGKLNFLFRYFPIKNFTAQDFTNNLYSELSFSIHFMFCWIILGIYEHVAVSVLMVIQVVFLLIGGIVSPFLRLFFNSIIPFLKNEHYSNN